MLSNSKEIVFSMLVWLIRVSLCIQMLLPLLASRIHCWSVGFALCKAWKQSRGYII